MTRPSPRPTAYLLFGANCVGKSEVGRALAAELPRCAFIEVDELCSMIVGGLVGWSRGASPLKYPAEYARQCALAERNAVALCHQFALDGFSSVVEGLRDECLPNTTWIRDSFGSLPVRTAALLCEPGVLGKRLIDRGWENEKLRRAVIDQSARYRRKEDLFDYVLDTTATDALSAAQELREALAR